MSTSSLICAGDGKSNESQACSTTISWSLGAEGPRKDHTRTVWRSSSKIKKWFSKNMFDHDDTTASNAVMILLLAAMLRFTGTQFTSKRPLITSGVETDMRRQADPTSNSDPQAPGSFAENYCTSHPFSGCRHSLYQ